MDILTLKKATNISKQHIGRGIIFPPKITEMPVVTFIADDGRIEDYTILKPMFEEHGIPFASAIVTDNIGKDGYLNAQQIKALSDTGNIEILSHAKTHTILTNLNETELEIQLRTSQEVLRQMGLKADHIVYPYGKCNNLVKQVARKYYRSGYLFKNTTGGLNTQPYNTYMLERIALGAYFDNPTGEYPVTSTFEDYYKKIVDKAVAQKAWLIITLHPGALSGEFTETQQSYLVQTIQYIKSLNVPVLNPSEVLDSMGNVIDIAAYDQSNSKEVLFQIGANGRIVSNQDIDWIYPELSGGWVNTPDRPLRWGIDSAGNVHITGRVIPTNMTDERLFYLPKNRRPKRTAVNLAVSNSRELDKPAYAASGHGTVGIAGADSRAKHYDVNLIFRLD